MFSPDIAESRASDDEGKPQPQPQSKGPAPKEPPPKEPEIVLPPRTVPITACVEIFFGGFFNQLAWFVFGLAIFLFWFCLLVSDVSSKYYFGGKLDTASGVVTASRMTGFKEGGTGHLKGTPIYANYYSFATGDGNEYSGVSYVVGLQIAKGENVKVEYPKGKPAVSRIKGMRWSYRGAKSSLLPGAFLVLSVVLVAAGIVLAVQKYRLLASGLVTTCWVKAKKSMNVMVGDQYVYRIIFEFKTPDEIRHTTVAKMPSNDSVDDFATEHLVYDPKFVRHAQLLNSMPLSLRMDPHGNIKVRPSVFRWLYLAIPAIIVLAHAAGIAWKVLAG